VDERELHELEAADLAPYRGLIRRGLAGVMPGHVIYPKVDRRPAGFSPVWLRDILRKRLGFNGMIFSDDLSMEGASIVGGARERAEAALDAGCDMLLICNDRRAAAEVLDRLKVRPLDPVRVGQMRGRGAPKPLDTDPRYAAAAAALGEVAS
jgi:beta-N-acetylhexosaminidase